MWLDILLNQGIALGQLRRVFAELLSVGESEIMVTDSVQSFSGEIRERYVVELSSRAASFPFRLSVYAAEPDRPDVSDVDFASAFSIRTGLVCLISTTAVGENELLRVTGFEVAVVDGDVGDLFPELPSGDDPTQGKP